MKELIELFSNLMEEDKDASIEDVTKLLELAVTLSSDMRKQAIRDFFEVASDYYIEVEKKEGEDISTWSIEKK